MDLCLTYRNRSVGPWSPRQLSGGDLEEIPHEASDSIRAAFGSNRAAPRVFHAYSNLLLDIHYEAKKGG